MKENRQDLQLLLACCFPCAFAVLYADLLHSNILWVVVMLLITVLLGLRLRKAGNMVLLFLGNGISLFLSCLLIQFFREPSWNAYFKPLGPTGTAAILQGYCVMLQYIIFLWNKKRGTVQNLFLALSIVCLLLSSFVYGFLCIQAARIGAI